MSAITIHNIGKKYKTYPNKRDRILEWLTKKSRHKERWVLRNITLKIEQGESIGVIGQNGAGKSTLLKLLTGTSQPSEGNIRVTGRVSALLELGMGFHPEFTGRQNVFTTGQLLGLTNSEITSLMPAIEDFAEIGDYIDRPLKTYSSGMAVRLAFAAATAVRPDILIVDEALSVGDAYFQHKCFRRIRSFKEEGTTLLFVSHDSGAVKNLCDRAVLLDRGGILKEGNPEEVIDYYNAVVAQREAEYIIKQTQGKGERVVTRSGNRFVEISKVQIFSRNEVVNVVQVSQPIEVVIEIKFKKEVYNPTIGLLIKDRYGNDIYGTNTFLQQAAIGKCEIGTTTQVSFAFPVNLGPGHYSLTIAVHDGANHIQGNYDWWEHADTLQVIHGNENTFIGTTYLPVSCTFVQGRCERRD